MSETRYNPERTREGDKFNQDPPAIEVDYDTGAMSEHNKQIADSARRELQE